MSKREWRLYIEDILESIDLIENYIESMKLTDFKQDRKTIDAVVRNLEIIGEATKYIPGEIKIKYPDIDWKGILGLRNRIVHQYFGLSLNIVWHIIKNELPLLKEQMKQIKEAKPC